MIEIQDERSIDPCPRSTSLRSCLSLFFYLFFFLFFFSLHDLIHDVLRLVNIKCGQSIIFIRLMTISRVLLGSFVRSGEGGT